MHPLIGAFLYVLAAGGWAAGASRPGADPHRLRLRLLLPGVAALLVHGLVLHSALVTARGLDFGFFNALSLVTWSAALLVAAGAFFKPVENLALIFFPAAAVGLVLDFLLSSERMVAVSVPLGVRVHIALSIVAYGLLAIAAAQALLLALQERLLRQRQPVQAMRLLPPLQIMEDLLVQILAGGFFFLTLSLATGFMFVENLLSQHLAHKTAFAVLGWFIFAVVLAGRWARGWRGQRLVRLTLGGFALLLLAYFGSKFVLELILRRV